MVSILDSVAYDGERLISFSLEQVISVNGLGPLDPAIALSPLNASKILSLRLDRLAFLGEEAFLVAGLRLSAVGDCGEPLRMLGRISRVFSGCIGVSGFSRVVPRSVSSTGA